MNNTNFRNIGHLNNQGRKGIGNLQSHNNRFNRRLVIDCTPPQIGQAELDFGKLTTTQRLVFLCAALSLMAGNVAMGLGQTSGTESIGGINSSHDNSDTLHLFPQVRVEEGGLVMTTQESVLGGALHRALQSNPAKPEHPDLIARAMDATVKGAVAIYNEHIDNHVPPTPGSIVKVMAEASGDEMRQGGVSELVQADLAEKEPSLTLPDALSNWVEVVAKANNISLNEDGTGILYTTDASGVVMETPLTERQVAELSIATAGRLAQTAIQALVPETSGNLVAAAAGGWESISPEPAQQKSIKIPSAPIRDAGTFEKIAGVDPRVVIANIEKLAVNNPEQLKMQYQLTVVELRPDQAQMLNFDPSIGPSGTTEPTKVLLIKDTANNYLTPAGSISSQAMEHLSSVVNDDFVNIPRTKYTDDQLYRGLFEAGAGLQLSNSDVTVGKMTVHKPDGSVITINKSDLGGSYNIGNAMEGRSPTRAHGPLVVEIRDAGGNYVGFIKTNAGEITLPKGLAAHQQLRHSVLAFLGSPDAIEIQKVVNNSTLNNPTTFAQLESGSSIVPDTASGLEYKVVSKSTSPGSNSKFLQVVVTTPDGGVAGSVAVIQNKYGRIQSYNLSGEQAALMGKMPATQTSMYTEKMLQGFFASGGVVEVRGSDGKWVKIGSQADFDNLLIADPDIPIPRAKGSYGNSSHLNKLGRSLQKGGVIMGWAGTGLDLFGYVAMYWQMEELDKSTINICGRDNNNEGITCTGADIVSGTTMTAMLRGSANFMLPIPQELRTSLVLPHRGFAELDPELMQSDVSDVITATAQFYKKGGPATGEALVVNSSEALISYKMYLTGGGDEKFSSLAPFIAAKGVDVTWHLTDADSNEPIEQFGYIEDGAANPELIGIPLNNVEKLPTLFDLGNLDSGIANYVVVSKEIETMDGEEIETMDGEKIQVKLIYTGFRDINTGKEVIFIQYDEGFVLQSITQNISPTAESYLTAADLTIN